MQNTASRNFGRAFFFKTSLWSQFSWMIFLIRQSTLLQWIYSLLLSSFWPWLRQWQPSMDPSEPTLSWVKSWWEMPVSSKITITTTSKSDRTGWLGLGFRLIVRVLMLDNSMFGSSLMKILLDYFLPFHLFKNQLVDWQCLAQVWWLRFHPYVWTWRRSPKQSRCEVQALPGQ